MSFIRDNLTPGEEIIFNGKLHWFIMIPHLIVVFLFAMTIIPAVLVDAVGWFFCCSGPCLLFGGAAAIDAFAKFITTEMVITNQRFITVSGLVNRTHFDMQLNRIEGIWVNRPMIGNVLDYGTLILSGPSGGQHKFALLQSPQQFREVLQQEVATRVGKDQLKS
jgi:hypothetical protein